MPVQTTYPGVYIEELPSGVRTITGVATSITAFVGRALKGEPNEPVTINNFSDFERQFGGLWSESTMSYAVQDFYLNGGSQAIIVRVDNGSGTAQLQLTAGAGSPPDGLILVAASPGSWANSLLAEVNYNTQDPTVKPASPPAPPDPKLFNLVIYQKDPETLQVQKLEEYLRVSVDKNDSRFLPRVLDQNSTVVGVLKDPDGKWVVPAVRPNVTVTPVAASQVDDGSDLIVGNYIGGDNDLQKTGLSALLKTDLFNLLCIPPPVRGGNTDATIYAQAAKMCVDKRAMLIVDPPVEWGANIDKAVSTPLQQLGALGVTGINARNAALYYPQVIKPDPLRENQPDLFVPSGIIAGLMATTDTNRGVWKSPAGIDAALTGVQSLQVNLSDSENGDLNQVGVNCLRAFPVIGRVIWGARTMRGADQLADDYKYVAVRRTALFIEESLYRGTKWVVFEPNDEPLWAQIRLNIGAFMQNLFRQGAFQGTTPKDAYLVKCDKETTTQNDINLGIVNILVAFAPLKPAEFVIIKIQQLAGQINT
ncbi:MAG: phage tail protein [Mucilaginibacter sp.]|nr:phage tail protein [Mucilaginibacter sp.]